MLLESKLKFKYWQLMQGNNIYFLIDFIIILLYINARFD